MTEEEWLVSTDPRAMLTFLRNSYTASDRKMRLFLVACARTVWDRMTDPTMRRAVETAERFADGCASSHELEATHGEVYELVYRGPHIHEKARMMGVTYETYISLFGLALSCGFSKAGLQKIEWTNAWIDGAKLTGQSQPSFLREIFGNPFHSTPLTWNNGTVVGLAWAVYENRLLPSGHLHPDRLAVLGIALEARGCTDAELLGHLREPGPHVRGCFAVDAVLGRE
jgi:hypothetical protein